MDLSIIVATYNPSKSKLFDTLYSLVNQRGLEYEIIICDDCSANACVEWCEEFFDDVCFDKYLIYKHDVNVGTCQNIFDGVERAKGKYVKLISPGDFLIGTDNLKDWYNFTVSSESKITFSRIANYYYEDEKKILAHPKTQPANEVCYLENGSIYDQKINYCYLSDTPVGAAYITERCLLEQYLKLIVGRIRYAEDLIYRLMVLDGIQVRMYPYECVAYECNTGISNSTNDKWVRILDEEVREIYNIAAEKGDKDKFTVTLLNSREYSGIKHKLYKLFCVSRYLHWLLKLKANKKITAGTEEMLVIRGLSDETETVGSTGC